MYIQITTRCNMSCAHCCYSCGSVGEDMSVDTFEKALEIAEAQGAYVTLGGGEPTIHPHFWKLLSMTLGSDCETVGIVTNGSKTKIAVALAALARKGVIWCDLSQDPWHEPIDLEVMDAFGVGISLHTYQGSTKEDRRGVCDVSENKYGPSPMGRALENNLSGHFDCVCDDLVIDPEGRIWSCGCKVVQFGTVFDPKIPDNYQEDLWDGYACITEYRINNDELREDGQPFEEENMAA